MTLAALALFATITSIPFQCAPADDAALAGVDV